MSVKFIKDVKNSRSAQLKNVAFKEEYVNIPTIAIENDGVYTCHFISSTYIQLRYSYIAFYGGIDSYSCGGTITKSIGSSIM